VLLDTDFSRLTRDFVGPRNKRRGPALRGAEAVAPIPHPRTARKVLRDRAHRQSERPRERPDA